MNCSNSIAKRLVGPSVGFTAHMLCNILIFCKLFIAFLLQCPILLLETVKRFCLPQFSFALSLSVCMVMVDNEGIL